MTLGKRREAVRAIGGTPLASPGFLECGEGRGRCSFDARNGRPIQAALLGGMRASLDGRLVVTVLQEMEGGVGVMLCIEGDIDLGLFQCQTEQFAFPWAVFNQ